MNVLAQDQLVSHGFILYSISVYVWSINSKLLILKEPEETALTMEETYFWRNFSGKTNNKTRMKRYSRTSTERVTTMTALKEQGYQEVIVYW